MTFANIVRVKEILEDHELNVFLQRNNAQDNLDFNEIELPAIIPVGIVIAVRPPPDWEVDLFWLAKVTEVLPSKKY